MIEKFLEKMNLAAGKIQDADFGKCAVRVAQQHAQHVPVKNLMERSNSDSGYEVKCKGFELPTIQEADFGKSGGAQDFCHSEGIRPKNPLHILKRFFAEYNFQFAGNCVRPAQNDGKILAPLTQDPTPKSKISTLPQGAGIKLPSSCCARGEGHNNVKHLFTYSLINLFTPKKKAAFTLAEVLITLGIIGVVAAMTIPNLIAEQQKRTTVTKLQRAISIINQAYKLSYDEVGELDADEALAMGSTDYFQTYWASYIKTAHICKTYSDCGFKTNFPWVLNNMKKFDVGAVATGARATFYTADGFLYVIMTGHWSNSKKTFVKDSLVYVDINGSTGPNRIGRDLFLLMRVTKDGGGVQPYGIDKTDTEVTNECKQGTSGYYCAEKIRRAGWKIEKDYPW